MSARRNAGRRLTAAPSPAEPSLDELPPAERAWMLRLAERGLDAWERERAEEKADEESLARRRRR